MKSPILTRTPSSLGPAASEATSTPDPSALKPQRFEPGTSSYNVARRIESAFAVPRAKLVQITGHFADELRRGLSADGGSTIPMYPTWCIGYPSGHETGTILTIDMGGTNVRVCEVELKGAGAFETTQSKYRIPQRMKNGTLEDLWEFVAECLEKYLEERHDGRETQTLPLGFTFSYPVMQKYIDHGVLERWTKGFDIAGAEGNDVVPSFRAALQRRNLPIELIALVNDTTGTLMAAAYSDPSIKIGCIFATGCNAAYMEECARIAKIGESDPDSLMAINCEWGAFDNDLKVLPRTRYDEIVDQESPRPGQQRFEKMVAGFYLGELYRLALLELVEDFGMEAFKNRDFSKLEEAYCLDTGFLATIENDNSENLQDTVDLFRRTLNVVLTETEVQVCRWLAEIIVTRAARLAACGVAALAKKNGWNKCRVGADGTVFSEYPGFRARLTQALHDILDLPEDAGSPIEFVAARDGSGVGAAVIVALTMKRAQRGDYRGIREAKVGDAMKGCQP
ncbi:hypothetical protein MPH_06352 [Macrophomina phaseolina MS6]|uniref:Phosphotransferase n=1 Tax=Macrophomina phaseolina (strain MS6) TaxID=1126212 RepID=K2RUR2_MACPH|nr:hypothetical protein MPH_06352 [Macrophomina phaseolina MS6]